MERPPLPVLKLIHLPNFWVPVSCGEGGAHHLPHRALTSSEMKASCRQKLQASIIYRYVQCDRLKLSIFFDVDEDFDGAVEIS